MRFRVFGRWAALALVAANACSEDAPAPSTVAEGGEAGAAASVGGEPGAQGGVAGEANGGAGAVAGVMAVRGGEGGEPSGGEGGVGGEPVQTPDGESCLSCAAAACEPKLAACSRSAECAPWLSCVRACDDASCAAECDDEFHDLIRVYRGVYECLCGACSAECAALRACEKQTCVPGPGLALSSEAPPTLAQTGISSDGVYEYEPKFPLWSDGAIKQRKIWLPDCSTIDTSDMDEWKFPVGTRVWKTFALGQSPIETRFMHRFGPGPSEWLYATYQWQSDALDDPTLATWTGGAVITNANGTAHDIPGNGNCKQCHDGRKERVLGFSAIQLSVDALGDSLDMRRISELGWLTTPAPEGFAVPGNPVQQAALGYLHGNCGGCHDQDGNLPDPESPMMLRLRVNQTDYALTDTVKTTVNVPVRSMLAPLLGKDRIEPHEPTQSGILVRMQARGNAGVQMPPFNSNSTKTPDTSGGVAAVTAWVTSEI